MPVYLGMEVSDEYMQGLIGAYRDGQKSVGGSVEDGDQVVIDRLSSQQVMSERAPSAFDLGKSDSGTSGGSSSGSTPGSTSKRR